MARTQTILWTVVTATALSAACDPNLQTEHRQVELAASVHSYRDWAPSNAIVEQSEVCPTFDGYRSSQPGEELSFESTRDSEIRACYTESISGPATYDDGCIFLESPGRVTWDLERKPCELGDGFGDDQLLFEVLPLSQARAAFSYSEPLKVEAFAELLDAEITGYSELPPDYVAPPGEPIYIIEDSLERLSAVVLRADASGFVTVTDPELSVVTLEGNPSVEISDLPSTNMAVSAAAGDAMQVRLTLPAGELDVGRVDIVSRNDVASLSLYPQTVRVTDSDFFYQLGALAITRDSDGNMLRRPPVTWSVIEGEYDLSLHDPDEDGVADPSAYAGIEDACGGAAPGEHRSAVLEGTITGLRETVRVEWDCVGTNEGCSCRSGSQAPGWALWLLPLLGVLRRRRRR